jgi:hypothetical protein
MEAAIVRQATDGEAPRYRHGRSPYPRRLDAVSSGLRVRREVAAIRAHARQFADDVRRRVPPRHLPSREIAE